MPPRRQAKCSRSSPNGGGASISKRRGDVWDDGGEGAINEPVRPHNSVPYTARLASLAKNHIIAIIDKALKDDARKIGTAT